MKEMVHRYTLTELRMPIRMLFTGYLLVIGLGLLMAGAQIMLTYGGADGKFGLTVDDIIYGYHGTDTTRLESKLNGSMRDNAPAEVRVVLEKWANSGAPAEEWAPTIKPLVDTYCAPCHANLPGLANITDKTVMDRMTHKDEGMSVPQLTRVSHIHLFGVSFIFFFVGWIFSYATGFSSRVQSLLIVMPFLFLIVDVASWWLTKWHENFAWLVLIAGFGYSLASTIMIFTSLYQMWVVPWRQGRPLFSDE